MEKAKKAILSAFIFIFILSLCGCGDRSADEQFQMDYETAQAIKKQIEDTPLPNGYGALIDDVENWILVNVQDGKATITIRSFQAYTIPYTAEFFIPIVRQAVENAGAQLETLDISSYNTNKEILFHYPLSAGAD